MEFAEKHTDVVVIGAGLAGLSAARFLHQAGVAVLLLEANNYIGGRAHSLTVAHQLPVGHAHSQHFAELPLNPQRCSTFDLGGQWIGTHQAMPLIHQLIQEFGLTLFPQLDFARMDFNSRLSELEESASYQEWAVFQQNLSVLADQIDVTHLGATSQAHQLDAITLESWSRQYLSTPYLQAVFDQAVRTEYGCEPRDISTLSFLYGLKTCGGLECMFSSDGGSHSYRLAEGFERLAEYMATPFADKILLNCPVQSVFQHDFGVRVIADNFRVNARKAIIAIPPNKMQSIQFHPLLPRSRSRLFERFVVGSIIKCFALYETAFWRDRPLRFIDPHHSILDHTLDASSWQDQQPAIVTFIIGNNAIRYSDQPLEVRQNAVLHELSLLFGEAALQPIHYFDYDWQTAPYIGGGYSAHLPPGSLATEMSYEQLRQPCGQLYWACTELATSYQGYFEGALQSGQVAAQQVLADSH